MHLTKLQEYKIIDGIKCFAPDVAYENSDYPTGHFDRLFLLEENNFWFKSRNRIIECLFSKYLGRKDRKKILEIGCGTGFVLKGLSRFTNLELYGAELYIEGLKFAKKRLPEAEFIQLDAKDIPYEAYFDAVGAFDVLEHIDEDILIMKNVNKSLRSKGLFFITVPQHKWLWSGQDETAYHKRRYSRKEMFEKLKLSGFSIEFISSYIFLLLPIMFLSRLKMKLAKQKSKKEYSYDELLVHPLINKALDLIIRFDELLIKFGVSIPCGGSMAVVARKC